MQNGVVDEAEELELRDYLRVLNHRKWTVLVVALLVVGSSVTASLLQTPVYRSTAELLLQPRSTESIFDPSIVQTFAGGKSAQTEIRVIESQPVRDLVREAIGSAPSINASNPADTDFVMVSAESTDPAQAARVANAYAEAYAEYRRLQAVTDLEKAAADLQLQIDELEEQIEATQTAGGRATALDPVPVTGLTQQRDLFSTRLGQIRLAIRQKTGGVQVVTPAVAATSPFAPTPERNAIVALFVGLILGVGLAFLRDYLDDSIRSKDDVERAVRSLPVLGMLPAHANKDRAEAYVVSVDEPRSPAAEAFRSLRTSVQFMGVERRLQVIQVTSASPGEGKSTTIANLAVALSRTGGRVAVVCSDLRRPRIHDFFGLTNDVGLTSVILGAAPLDVALQAVPGLEGLRVLASGPLPPNPSELLAGTKMGYILQQLRDRFDLVLVDCPPVLPVTDAAVVAGRVDGTLLLALAGSTSKKELHRAYEILRQVDAPLLGTVLNGVPDSGAYGYGYRYKAAYGGPAKPSRGPLPAEPEAALFR